MVAERREFQRLRLAKPILALLDGHSALLIDIGLAGTLVEHHGIMAVGKRFRLTFRWNGEDVEFICEARRSDVVRTSGDNPVSHTGARFVEGIDGAGDRLQNMIMTFVARILAAQKTNASATAEEGADELLVQLGAARRARARGFVIYRFDGNAWTHTATDVPFQPANGFTVGAYEDEEELETLCHAYEMGDEEARRLIRMVAELSARNVKK